MKSRVIEPSALKGDMVDYAEKVKLIEPLLGLLGRIRGNDLIAYGLQRLPELRLPRTFRIQQQRHGKIVNFITIEHPLFLEPIDIGRRRRLQAAGRRGPDKAAAIQHDRFFTLSAFDGQPFPRTQGAQGLLQLARIGFVEL